MLKFFKYVLATIVGLFLFFVISFFLLAGIGSALSSSSGTVKLKENSVLRLNFDGNFGELKAPDDPFSELISPGSYNIGLNQFKEVLANAALDPDVKGISININNPNIGFGQMEEVLTALKEFKKSDKFVYSYSDYMSEGAVLLAALTDSSFINPMGSIEFNGLASEITFYKGALDKLGLEPLVFRVGEFKSAVEPFIRKDMSSESKLQVSEYLNSIADNVYADYAKNKGISKDKVDEILNQSSMLMAEDAVKHNLITGVAYSDQYEDIIRERIGVKKGKKINYVSYGSYTKAKKHVKPSTAKDRIAVIVSEGEIIDGEAAYGQIGSKTFVKELRKVAKDDKVKAIVLRINSPGGSALASDIMWREIQLAREKKPVIASMGDLAASGGYYMAMGTDTIVAHPSTITGSIGIFGLLLNTEKLMNDKLGLTFDGVKTHTFADSPSMTRKMSDAEMQTIQNSVNRGYEVFTSKAAEGRKMDIDALKAVAGGRVWTGSQALERGLVDVLGNLDDAIKIAAEKADVEEYRVRYYPSPKSEFDLLVEKMTKKDSDAKIKQYLGDFGEVYDLIKANQNKDYIQARMPYSIKIK